MPIFPSSIKRRFTQRGLDNPQTHVRQNARRRGNPHSIQEHESSEIQTILQKEPDLETDPTSKSIGQGPFSHLDDVVLSLSSLNYLNSLKFNIHIYIYILF